MEKKGVEMANQYNELKPTPKRKLARMLLSSPWMRNSAQKFAGARVAGMAMVLLSSAAFAIISKPGQDVKVNVDQNKVGYNRQQVNRGVSLPSSGRGNRSQTEDPNIARNYRNFSNRRRPTNYSWGQGREIMTGQGQKPLGSMLWTAGIDIGKLLWDEIWTGDGNFTDRLFEIIGKDIVNPFRDRYTKRIPSRLQALTGLDRFAKAASRNKRSKLSGNPFGDCPTGDCNNFTNVYKAYRNWMNEQAYNDFAAWYYERYGSLPNAN